MTEYNADKAQENAAREEATHEESMHNKTTQEKAAQKKSAQEKSAQEITGSELRKAEEEALKKRLALRVTAPGHKYPWHRWAIPIVGETTAGIGAILIPVMVGQFINQHIAGKAPDAWPMFWVVVASITFIVINEFFGWGTSMTLSAELGRDWRVYINRLMGRTRTTVDAGEAVTVMNKDVRRITAVYFSLPLFVNAMIIATLGAVQLWLINPVTAVVTLIGTLIVVGVIAWYSSFLESKIGEYREKDGEASSRASDIATGLRTIAGLGAEEQMRERYHRGTDEVFDSYMRYEKTHRWMYLIRALLGGAVTLLGIGFALTGHVENGRWVSDTPAASLVTVASII
ncbi:MAG: ABC transporter transmembrane domain-containing protein, partial [Rothia mucilaginosa]